MNYLEYDLGQQAAGARVTVNLDGVESDVFLVDGINRSRFKAGRQFQHVGGRYKRSPVVLGVPRQDHWYAMVVPGAGGTVRASVAVAA